jgi:hypothetical protein
MQGVRRQRPAMADDDGLSFAPVVVINLRSVLGFDRRHAKSPYCLDDIIARAFTVETRAP